MSILLKSQTPNTTSQLIKSAPPPTSLSSHIKLYMGGGGDSLFFFLFFFFFERTDTQHTLPVKKGMFHLTHSLAWGSSESSSLQNKPLLTGPRSAHQLSVSSWASHLLCVDTWPEMMGEYGRYTFSPNVLSRDS